MSLSEPSTLKSSSIKAASKLPDRIIETDALNFRQKFNRSPFMFSHNLVGHPLFEIPRLVELSNTLLSKGGRKRVACMVSDSSAHRTWGELTHQEQVAEAISRIEESGSLVFLKSAQLDPEYKAMLDKCLVEFEDLIGVPLQQEITWSGATIIIASPHSITPYHIDHESNFLFQIHGEKDTSLFNPDDRLVLTEQEIEQYYVGNFESANYKEENQSKASIYHLIPGKGVHQPSRAPHWVKNGNNVSVALSISFCMQSIDWQARVYQTNHYLRKLGLKPTPPGKSPLQDNLKNFAIGMFSKRKPESHEEVLCSGIKRITAPIGFAARTQKRLKQISTKIVRKVPIVADYYHYYWSFPREHAAYRGVFNTFSEALQALPTGSRSGHNQPEIHNHSLVEVAQFTARLKLEKLESRDYPVLVWLASAFNDSSIVFDLGGNVGVSYYAYRKYLHYPDNLRWVVCEVSEIVKAGEKLVGETDSPGLSFTGEFSDAEGSDILLTCGTLQYLEPSLAELLGQLKAKPKHILINYVPFYDGESFITLQNISYAFSPYKIQNRAEFIAALSSLGYELIDSWEDNRTCSIPFHPERFVHAYHGFYLRLNKEAESGQAINA